MVKHVILWKLKDDIANKQEVLENIKQHLEAGAVIGRTVRNREGDGCQTLFAGRERRGE